MEMAMATRPRPVLHPPRQPLPQKTQQPRLVQEEVHEFDPGVWRVERFIRIMKNRGGRISNGASELQMGLTWIQLHSLSVS